MPRTIVDAVQARLRALDPRVQDALEQLAVVPSALDRWLVDALVPDAAPGRAATLAAAEQGGMLSVSARKISFRHELTRRAIASSLPAARLVALNQRAAERWRTARWDSLRLITPNWMSGLPGWPHTGPDPDGYTPAAELARHLRSYARSFGAPVHERTTVERVETAAAGLRVVTDQQTWIARNVVVATGTENGASLPALTGRLEPALHQLAAARYRSSDQVPDGGVLVVGASASGVQIADELRRSGRPVILAAGRHTRLPRCYRGRDILRWMHQAGILGHTIEQMRDVRSARRAPSLQLSGRGHRVDLAALAAPASSAIVYRYFRDVPAAGYHWYYAPGSAAGSFPPTTGWPEPSPPPAPVTSRPASPAPGCGSWPRPPHPNWLRGWALVGDAGYFKDPITAHGITDAQLLVRAVTSRELGSYQAERDELSLRLFRVTGRIASFSWTADGIGELLALTLADEVTRP